MILQIIQLLLISLGFNNTNSYNAPRSLHPQQRYTQSQRIRFNISPLTLVILTFLGMILFVLFIFLFMPGTESGVVYNQFDNII